MYLAYEVVSVVAPHVTVSCESDWDWTEWWEGCGGCWLNNKTTAMSFS